MAVIDTADFLYRAGNYSGSGDWLDESGNGRDLTVDGSSFTAEAGSDLAFFTFDGVDDFMRYTEVAAEYDPEAGDFTVLYVIRSDDYVADRMPVDTKDSFTASDNGWLLRVSTNKRLSVLVGDGTNGFTDLTVADTLVDGTRHVGAFRLDRTAEELEVFVDGTGTGTPADTTGLGSVGGTAVLDVGRVSNAFESGELYALAIWKGTALSDADIATAGDELQELAAADGAGNLLLLGVG